jgi:hypothetical protein
MPFGMPAKFCLKYLVLSVNYYWGSVIAYTLLMPGVIGAIRYKKLDKSFFPFIWLMWIGVFNETFSHYADKKWHTNAVNNNIYSLVEFIMLLWQFKKWKLFDHKNNGFKIISTAAIFFWVIENFFIYTIDSFNSYFIICSSLCIALLSIRMINILVLREKDVLLKNATFLICISFVLYYTYAALVEAFWVYGLGESKEFGIRIQNILLYINLFANLVYALAVCWIPTRPRFILQS